MKRLYVPDGTFMNHHHAHQFLSFRAPALPPREVGARSQQQHQQHQHRFFGSLLGTSSSFDDASSQLSNPSASDMMLLPYGADTNHDKLNSSSSTAGSTPSPSRRLHHHQHQHRGYAPRFSSHFGPTLPAVGEVMTSSAKDIAGKSNKPASTSHYILADLEATTKNIDFSEQPRNEKKKKKGSLFKLLAPLNCASCLRSGGSKKGDDGYSSSWGGDGSSSNNHSNGNDNQNGRDTPTSKGSAGDDAEESVNWNNKGSWEGVKCLEDCSIISDSAPLLASILGSSQRHEKQHPILARPTPFSRKLGKF